MIRVEGVCAVLTDIEGTTGSIAFVKDTLFPYARRRMAAFVAAHPTETAPILDAVRQETGRPDIGDRQAVQVLLDWMDEDRKATPLKALQGMIWREGYESGRLVGHIYDDAARGLKRWAKAGLHLYVYSSGSIEAQQLIFRHSRKGDLSGLFIGWFDTTTGPKTDPASYLKICQAADCAPAQLLFLTDSEAEQAAAYSAGVVVVRLARDGPQAAGTAASFDEIEIA